MNFRHYILVDKIAKAVPMLTWARWMETNRLNRHVADDMVGKVRVSTVFLGIDHQFGKGPPLLFETMIFGGAFDERAWRYSTWAQAAEGHNRALYLVREMVATRSTKGT